MNAVIGKMSKRLNSTKRSFSGTTHKVVLKDSISMKNPKLLITGKPDSKSNYMSFNDMYYWIDDIVSETNDLYWVVAHIDQLATFKPSIINSSGLVRFGPSDAKSTSMDDPRFGPDIPWLAARQSAVIPGVDIFSKGGSVVLTVTAATDTDTNGICQYILSYTEVMNYLKAFGGKIKTDMNGSNDIKEAIINMVIGATGGGNWSDNIKSMIWLPFNPDIIIAACNAKMISEMGIGGYRITGSAVGWVQTPIAIHKVDGSLNIPWQDDTNIYRFLRNSKYTSMTLCHPCGSVDIHTDALIDQPTVHYTVAINMLNGDYYVKIKESSSDSAEPLAYAQGNVSIDVTGMIASGGTVGGNALSAIFSVAKNVLFPSFLPASPAKTNTTKTTSIKSGSEELTAKTTNDVDTTHSTMSSGIEKNFMSTGTPPSSCSATLSGSVLNLYQTTSFESQFYIQMNAKKPHILLNPTDYDNYCEEYGYPVNNYMSLSNVSGYVECADISIKPAGSILPNESELSSLNSALCSGIYIE